MATVVVAAEARAAEPDTALREELERLRELVLEQSRKMDAQERQIVSQGRQLEALQSHVQDLNRPRIQRAVQRVVPPPAPDKPAAARRVASDQGNEQPGQVGQPPEKQRRARPPEILTIDERGGVLTPKNTLVLEPSLEYTQTSTNQFLFQGISVLEAILIGVIEVSQADRDAITAAATARYGLTDRLEAEAKVPYVYRQDRITTQAIQPTAGNVSTREPEASDVGDAEFALHYQLNGGHNGWPFLIGNARVKTDTGVGPFDVKRDSDGVETELPTGSGFWSVEPSLTMIYPSDPAVVFASLGYLWNMERAIDQQVGGVVIGDVNPGDAITTSVGFGFALNDVFSATFGYKHNFIDGSTTEINGVDVDTDSLDVGSAIMGLSVRPSSDFAINLTVESGVTEDAPDARVFLRTPITLDLG